MKRMQARALDASTGAAPADAITVDLYRDGFTVDGGAFRPLSDPMNRKFVDDMAAGNCPSELAGAMGAGPVDFTVNDKRGEDYKAPKTPAAEAFSGEGMRLSDGASSSAAVVTADAGTIEVDPSKPKGRVQIRLADGTKKAQEFNETHTVDDLCRFCSQCTGGQPVKVLGGFPPKDLTDGGATLKDAGILNSAVTVKPA